MILRYLLRTFCIVTWNLVNINSALMLRTDRLTQQAMHFFSSIGDDILIYGITQDCQLYFVEHVNYMLIKSLQVDRSNTYCYPNLVKLHLRQGIKKISLTLIIKQVGNSICTMSIAIPPIQAFKNEQIFSYSVYTSLPYTACSYLRDSSFILEPDLSFIDSLFSDIIYFINAKSVGSQWDVRQFRINDRGNLIAMKKFAIYHPLNGDHASREIANQFIVELDLKRSLLYTLNRSKNSLLSECSYDLLFRPSNLIPRWFQLANSEQQGWIESFAVDGQIMLFTVSTRNERAFTSELYGTNLKISNNSLRLLHLDFVTDICILQKGTYGDLSARTILAFDDMRQRATKHVYKKQQIISYAPHIYTVLNISSIASRDGTTMSPTKKIRILNEFGQLYSEIKSYSTDIKTKNHRNESSILTSEPLLQHSTRQHWPTIKTNKGNETDTSNKKLVGNMEETREMIFPRSTVGEWLWENDKLKAGDGIEHEIFNATSSYGDDIENKNDAEKEYGTQAGKDALEFPQIYTEEGDIMTKAIEPKYHETPDDEARAPTFKISCALRTNPTTFAHFITFLYLYANYFCLRAMTILHFD